MKVQQHVDSFPRPADHRLVCDGTVLVMGGATGGCGGTMSLPLLGPAGYRGVQRDGPMKMIFASTAESLYSVLYK